MATATVEVPRRMRTLPKDKHGRLVPWFVAYIEGVPDHRIVRPGGVDIAHAHKICWLCGQGMSAYKAFTIGPMCAVNRVSAEPPSHKECAEYAVKVCPFLTRPDMRRRDVTIQETMELPGGEMIDRNPGVTLIWVTRTYTPEHVGNGVIFRIGDPVSTDWYAEGRQATRKEVLASIDSGLPILHEYAKEDGPAAELQLAAQVDAALRLVPAA